MFKRISSVAFPVTLAIAIIFLMGSFIKNDHEIITKAKSQPVIYKPAVPRFQKVIRINLYEQIPGKELNPWLEKGYVIEEMTSNQSYTLVYLVKY